MVFQSLQIHSDTDISSLSHQRAIYIGRFAVEKQALMIENCRIALRGIIQPTSKIIQTFRRCSKSSFLMGIYLDRHHQFYEHFETLKNYTSKNLQLYSKMWKHLFRQFGASRKCVPCRRVDSCNLFEQYPSTN